MKLNRLLLVIIVCLLLVGCKKTNTDENKLLGNIKIEEIGVIKSDIGEECLLLKATNNNAETVTVFSTVTLYDSSNKELSSEMGYLSLYSGQENYYVVEISSENKYDSYKVTNEASVNLYNDYKNIYKNTKLEQTKSDDKELISFSVNNKNNKEVSAKILGIFYKNSKIIAASVGFCDSIEAGKTCEDNVYVPIENLDQYNTIDYDKVDISIMDVNYAN